jgi:hypothetical protein
VNARKTFVIRLAIVSARTEESPGAFPKPVCRQNLIGSVDGELRNHEIWEIQVDAFLKLDRAAKTKPLTRVTRWCRRGFSFSGAQAGISWLWPG